MKIYKSLKPKFDALYIWITQQFWRNPIEEEFVAQYIIEEIRDPGVKTLKGSNSSQLVARALEFEA